jgi:hypothetical protein
MNKYRYFWDGGVFTIHAGNIEEAGQLVFDLDRIPYDIIEIPIITLDTEVTDHETEKDTATEGKKNPEPYGKENAGQAPGHEARGLEPAGI